MTGGEPASTGRATRAARVLAGVVALATAAIGVAMRPDRAIRVASAFVSQTVCSAVFVSRLDADHHYAAVLRPMGKLSLLDPVLRFRVDTSRQDVSTSVAGLFRSRAVYRANAGCTLVHGRTASTLALAGESHDSGDALPLVYPKSERLRNVFERAFSRSDLATVAVVVIWNDSIIAERYGPGYSVETRLQGWSLKKSVVNALVAVLVRQGRLAVQDSIPIPTWHRDPRRTITIDHLLRMTSGLALEETQSGFDAVSRLLFLERDMAAFAERARLEVAPGTRFAYTTGNTVLLSRVVRDLVGGRGEDVVRFAREELFGPLRMTSAVLELDATGTPIAMYATARDWARFAQMYATDGIVRGRRLLPLGWVRYSTIPTLTSGYGAGWWLAAPQWRPDWDLPADAFYGSGHLHQKLLVVPSAHLVVARFGATHAPDDGFGTLAQEVLAAVAENARLRD